jgi:acetyltransferase-like isoleucine patch superfamily enzyme
MLDYLIKKFENYNKTCLITDIEDSCVTFMRDGSYSKYLVGIDKDIWVIVPESIGYYPRLSDNVKFCRIDGCPDYAFTLYHNEVHKDDPIIYPTIGKNCDIHPTAVMNVEAFKVAYAPDGSKIQFRHIGNVIIEDDVKIGPQCVIHRGTMKSTIIRKGVRMSDKNSISHNNIIGKNTVFATGVITNGSVVIGQDCWLASGALIRDGISICNNVVVGMGAVVVKDITVPGVYAGNPARMIKPYKKGMTF